MEQELRIAREIQESLMPRALPASGWFRAAASNLPSFEVGGDYLDIRQIGDSSWAAVAADVSGKGVGAALLASLLQGMFLVAPYARLPLEEMVLRVSRYLNERTGGEQYATVFYCTVAFGGELRWVNAGHPPPILARASGAVESLAANGLPVGLIEEASYAAEESRLEPGDKIVIYSDGLSEAHDRAGEFFGIKRLREIARLESGGSCRDVLDAILAAVERFTEDAPQSDDVSIAVLEYRPETA
jgi:serine phosphatase RsbU (regulator of sigma subunit)